MMKRLPFIPISGEKLEKIIRHYIGIGEGLIKFFPGMEFELEQAEFEIGAREWLALAFFLLVNYFSVIFGVVLGVALVLKIVFMKALLISILVGAGVGFAIFFYLIFYPKLLVARKMKDLESNLPHALRHMLIQVRSGMPLYSSLVSISKSDYGRLSTEFRRAIKEINTGKSEIEALETLARENPSLYFRRILWQLINAMKTGADIGVTLKEIVDSIIEDQRVKIKKYGAQLNPIALFYMITVVIFPTLGIVFLLVLTSFIGASFNLHLILMGVLAFLFIVQFVFIGMIKSKRPLGI